MSQLIDLANQMETIYKKLLSEVEAEKKDQTTTRRTLTERKKKLDDREASIVSKEAELKKNTEVVEAKLTKIHTDEELSRTLIECQTLRDDAEKKLKLAHDRDADADLKLSWVADREKSVSERETTYRTKIEKEYQDKIVKSLLK